VISMTGAYGASAHAPHHKRLGRVPSCHFPSCSTAGTDSGWLIRLLDSVSLL